MTIVVTSNSRHVVCGNDVATVIGGQPAHTVVVGNADHTVNATGLETTVVVAPGEYSVNATPASQVLVAAGTQGPPGVSATQGVRLSRDIAPLVNRDVDTVSTDEVISSEWTITLLDRVTNRYKHYIVSANAVVPGPCYVVYGIINADQIPVETTVTYTGANMVLNIRNLHDQILTANLSRIDINRVV